MKLFRPLITDIESNLLPDASGTLNLGSVSLAFNDAYIDRVYLEADPTTPLQAATKQYVDSQIETVDDHNELNNLNWAAAGHTIDADVNPASSGVYDLGSPALRYAEAHIDDIYANDIYTSGGSLHVGAHTLSDANNALNSDASVALPEGKWIGRSSSGSRVTFDDGTSMINLRGSSNGPPIIKIAPDYVGTGTTTFSIATPVTSSWTYTQAAIGSSGHVGSAAIRTGLTIGMTGTTDFGGFNKALVLRSTGVGTNTAIEALEGEVVLGSSFYDCGTITMIKGAQTGDPQVQFALSADANGDFSITTDTGDIVLQAAATKETVVNEAGADVDFRVETDTDANAFIIDAGANEIKPGVNTVPDASGTLNLGSVSYAFNNAYIDQINLKADPTSPLMAATKQYVDAITESDTLQTVTDRGSTTSNTIINTNTSTGSHMLISGNNGTSYGIEYNSTGGGSTHKDINIVVNGYDLIQCEYDTTVSPFYIVYVNDRLVVRNDDLIVQGGNISTTTGNVTMGTVSNDTGTFTMIKGAQTGDPQVTMALSSDANGDFSITADTGDIVLQAAATKEVVVNELGADADFRVEGDNQPNAIIIDGGNGSFTYNASTSNSSLTPFQVKDSLGYPLITCNVANTSGSAAGSEIVFNELGLNYDFRVESDGNANMLFVDGGNNRVGVGTSTPNNVFEVYGSSATAGVVRITNEVNASDVNHGSLNIVNTKTPATNDNMRVMFSALVGASVHPLGSMGAIREGTSYATALQFNTRETDVLYSEKMRISSSGDVGIGTTDPNSGGVWTGKILRVRGSATSSRVYIDGGDAYNAGIGIVSGGSIKWYLGSNGHTAGNMFSIGRTTGIETSDPWFTIAHSTGNIVMGSTTVNSGTFSMIQGAVASDPTFSITQTTNDVEIKQTVGKMNLTAVGEVVVNDLGADVDFRVESDTNANMLFVDAGNNNVGVGTGSPNTGYALHVSDERVVGGVLISGNNAPGVTLIDTTNSAKALMITQNEGSLQFYADIDNIAANTVVKFQIDNVADVLYMTSSQAVFNESGADVDFRVEGDTNTNLIMADAGLDTVGIGGAAVTGQILTLTQNSDTIAMSHDGTDAFMKWSDGNLYLMTDEGTNTISNVYIKGKGTSGASLALEDGNSSNNRTFFQQIGTVAQTVYSSATTEFVFNQGGADVDFRVEGDTDANLLFCDAGNDRVGIGTNSPTSALDIDGDIEVGSSNYIYMGDPTTDGSWRFGIDSGNMVVQKRESGSWVTKGTFSS